VYNRTLNRIVIFHRPKIALSPTQITYPPNRTIFRDFARSPSFSTRPTASTYSLCAKRIAMALKRINKVRVLCRYAVADITASPDPGPAATFLIYCILLGID